MVAVTLDLTEEELFFQFGMDNWSAYVDQVTPCFSHCLSMPCCCWTWDQCMHVRTYVCVMLLPNLELLHVDARVPCLGKVVSALKPKYHEWQC